MKLVAVFFLAALQNVVHADVVLSDGIMKLARTAASLSSLAYHENPVGDDYEKFGFYDEEPDQAIVAKRDGYCYGAFRGTTLTWIDWQQNFDPHHEDICDDKGCCTTRRGFHEAYMTHYREDFEKSLRECAKDCDNADECVVLTGHSQGGAIAAVAALMLTDLNPYVFTYGQPTTIDAPCDKVTSERWFRFVNTKESDLVGICYDPVPFVPGLGADSFGHMILLSNDTSGVAYIGLDAQDYFGPLNVAGFEAHSITSDIPDHPGYLERIDSLMAGKKYPIRNNGYVAGSLCTEHKECESGKCEAETHVAWYRCVGTQCKKDKDCPKTGRCDSGVCIPKLGSCQACDEDSDCASDKCLLFRCAGSSGLMDNDCVCKRDKDCESGRCEGLVPPQCEAALGIGAHCNEHSDCKSDYCNWQFQCDQASKESNKSRTGGIVLCVFLAAAVAVLVYFGYGKYKRWREGYDTVPSTMDV